MWRVLNPEGKDAIVFADFVRGMLRIAEDPELKQSRLVLCYITGRILRRGLELLGISVVDQM